MVAWYWLIVAFFVGALIMAFVYEWLEECGLISDALAWIMLIILYVPCCIYHIFFKLTIKPVPQENFNRFLTTLDNKTKGKELFPNFWIWVDPTAKYVWNKIFFLRVEKSS